MYENCTCTEGSITVHRRGKCFCVGLFMSLEYDPVLIDSTIHYTKSRGLPFHIGYEHGTVHTKKTTVQTANSSINT